MFSMEKSIPYLKRDSFFKNHRIGVFILAVFISLIVDIGIYKIEEFFEIALFLEYLGVVIITFCYGIIPGLISGFSCQLIIALVDQKSILFGLYGLNGVFLAFIIWLSFRKDSLYPEFLHLLFVYVITVVSESFIGGTINNLIDVLERGETDWESYSWFITILIAQGIPVHASNLLGRIPVNLISQIINVLGGYCVARLIEYISSKITKTF